MEEHLKGMVVPGPSEELGLNYIGPIDGHDVNMMVDALRIMRNLKAHRYYILKRKKVKVISLLKQIQLATTAYQNLTQACQNYQNQNLALPHSQMCLVTGYVI